MRLSGIWWHGWWGSTVPPRKVRTTGQKIQGIIERFVKDIVTLNRAEARKGKK